MTTYITGKYIDTILNVLDNHNPGLKSDILGDKTIQEYEDQIIDQFDELVDFMKKCSDWDGEWYFWRDVKYLYCPFSFKSRGIKIPATIGDLTALKSWDLSVSDVEEIPESIGNLTSLTYLNLEGNQIESLPESFKNLSSLTFLKVDDNLLPYLSEDQKEVARNS